MATIPPEGSVSEPDDVVVRPLANHKIIRRIGIAYGAHRALSPGGWEVIAKLKALAQSKLTPALAFSAAAPRGGRSRARSR